jgi:hypothetical protein
MAETGGTYLPPVIASLVGEIGDLAKTLVEAKAMVADFAATDATVNITAELTSLADLQMDLFKDIGGVQALAEANPIEVPMQLDMFQLLSETSAFRLFAEQPIEVKIEPKVDVAATVAAVAATRAAAATASSAGGGGNILSILGFGTAGFGAGAFGLAGFGSIAALAGFGLERVITLTIGLVGSLMQALGGLGVIAAGTFATMAVGMGSDMLVMKSTIADTQTFYKTLTQLEQAQIQYGANSAQAAYYTQLLNTQVTMLGNTAGVQAELGLAKLAMTINQQWDQATSNARVQAVALLTQILYLGQTYIPLVAEAARRNLAIINTGLMPLFDWLKGPEGIGIFTDLENKFAKNLPTAIDAFNQAIMFLLRFLDLASNYTGGFIQGLDRLFTYLNSPAGWARVKRDVQDVVNVFMVWRAFIVILFRDIALLLGQSVGVGTSMIVMLTQILNKLHDYLTSTSGKNAVGSLFQAHKAEIVAILTLLPQLAGPVASIYLSLAVPLTNIATAIANIVSWLLNIPGAGPVIAYGLAFAFLAGKLQLVALWSFLSGVFLALAGAIEIAGLIASGATVQFGALAISLDGVAIGEYAIIAPILIILALFVLLVVGIILLITHWKQVSAVVQQVWKDVVKFVTQLATDVGKFFSNLGTMVEKGWSNFAARPGYWIGYMIGTVVGKLLVLGQNFDSWFGQILGKVAAWGANMASGAPGALAAFLTSVNNEIGKLPGQVWNIGVNIVIGLWNGIKSMQSWLGTQLNGFISGLIQGALNALGSKSPSMKFAEVGKTIPAGLALGVHSNSGLAMSALSSVLNQMSSVGAMAARGGMGTGGMVLAGAGGRGPISLSAPVTINMAPGASSNPQMIAQAVSKAIDSEFDHLITRLQGGVYSTPGT